MTDDTREAATHAAAPDALAGDWTIYRAAELHAVLRERLAAGATRLDLSAVEAIDCAGLQLLLAARRSAHRDGRPLVLAGASAPVRTLCDGLGQGALLDEDTP